MQKINFTLIRTLGLFSKRIVSLENKNYIHEISRKMSTKKALVLLPAGAEEMEFVIAVDVLRRGGVSVQCAGLNGTEPVKCSRDVVIVPDVSLTSTNYTDFDCIVLPGGLGGAKAMSESKAVGEILKKFEDSGKIIAAICAAPTVLLAHSIGLGKKITSYPSMKDKLVDKYVYDDKNIVVQDGQFVTSRGPGTAFDFGLKLVEVLVGVEKSKEVAKGMLL